MRFLLDTNAWVVYLRQNQPQLVQRFSQESSDDIAMCSVVVAELLYGAHHSPPAKQAANLTLVARLQERFVSLPFDDQAAAEFGRIREELARAGTPIGPYDLMIASIALTNGLTLVTHNTREFSRVSGLMLEDWQ